MSETKNTLVIEENPIMTKVYKVAIDKPTLSVNDVLKEAGVTQHLYKVLCSSHLTIGNYRRIKLGQSKILSEKHKEKIKSSLHRQNT